MYIGPSTTRLSEGVRLLMFKEDGMFVLWADGDSSLSATERAEALRSGAGGELNSALRRGAVAPPPRCARGLGPRVGPEMAQPGYADERASPLQTGRSWHGP
jgi:hypothetical protein